MVNYRKKGQTLIKEQKQGYVRVNQKHLQKSQRKGCHRYVEGRYKSEPVVGICD